MRLELERVGGLVQGDPRPERGDRDTERSGGLPDVLLDEQKPAWCGLHGQQGEVVLTQDTRAHEPEQETELPIRHPAIRKGHRRFGEAAAGWDDLVEELTLELADQRRERAGVG